MKFSPILLLWFSLIVPGTSQNKVDFSAEQIKQVKTLSPLPKVKEDPTNKVGLNPKAALFGEQLFGDWRLSRGEEFACQSCHRTTDEWMTVRSDTDRDIPTLWNITYNRWFFWDGRADSLWAQALGPIENPQEHDFSRGDIAKLISQDQDYRKVYEELFGEMGDFSDNKRFPIPAKPAKYDQKANKNWQSMSKADQHEVNKVFSNVGKALAAFQMTITSPKTDFDVFVEGVKENNPIKKKILSVQAQQGLKLFLGKGRCIDCHSGPSFTDGLFHNTQLPGEGVEIEGRSQVKKQILNSEFNSAGKYSDDVKFGAELLRSMSKESGGVSLFKTPTLRNIVNTNPYMHKGQFRSLIDVIDFYSDMKGASTLPEGQRLEIEPRNFSKAEKQQLLAFLKSLSRISKQVSSTVND